MKTDILNHEKILSIFNELEQNPARVTQRKLIRKIRGSGACLPQAGDLSRLQGGNIMSKVMESLLVQIAEAK